MAFSFHNYEEIKRLKKLLDENSIPYFAEHKYGKEIKGYAIYYPSKESPYYTVREDNASLGFELNLLQITSSKKTNGYLTATEAFSLIQINYKKQRP